MKCWNLEHIIDADLMRDSQPLELTMYELVNESEADASASSTTTEVVEVND